MARAVCYRGRLTRTTGNYPCAFCAARLLTRRGRGRHEGVFHQGEPVTDEQLWARAAESLEEKVDRSNLDGCWPTNAKSYRKIVVHVGSRELRIGSHRLSYELANGPVPAGLWVLHHCDNPPCVRPDHLFVGNRSDNMRDAASKGRLWKQRGRAA